MKNLKMFSSRLVFILKTSGHERNKTLNFNLQLFASAWPHCFRRLIGFVGTVAIKFFKKWKCSSAGYRVVHCRKKNHSNCIGLSWELLIFELQVMVAKIWTWCSNIFWVFTRTFKSEFEFKVRRPASQNGSSKWRHWRTLRFLRKSISERLEV